MPQLNIFQRLSGANLKEIMILATEREKLSQKLQEIQGKIKGIDEKIAELYSETYTDPQTAVYVPNEFAHEALAKSRASIRKMATSVRGGKKK